MAASDKPWVVYMLRCSDGSLYTGITNDLEKRFAAHKQGKGAKYTRSRGPLSLVYQQVCEDHSHALKEELRIKALSKEEKIKLIKE